MLRRDVMFVRRPLIPAVLMLLAFALATLPARTTMALIRGGVAEKNRWRTQVGLKVRP